MEILCSCMEEFSTETARKTRAKSRILLYPAHRQKPWKKLVH